MTGSDRLAAPSFGDVAIDDGFWTPRIERTRAENIAYQYDQLGSSGCLGNFR